ncbi:MAG: hypothetical protein LBC61_04235 [Candidatus Peribacteria bacterium]|nr:hypothetical protein [Candidatus Peribacteria bacterium]
MSTYNLVISSRVIDALILSKSFLSILDIICEYLSHSVGLSTSSTLLSSLNSTLEESR